jgi:hypothetical protein
MQKAQESKVLKSEGMKISIVTPILNQCGFIPEMLASMNK